MGVAIVYLLVEVLAFLSQNLLLRPANRRQQTRITRRLVLLSTGSKSSKHGS